MRSLRLLHFLVFVPLFVGCGLPDSYNLQPPVRQNLAGLVSNNFEFLNPDHSTDLGVSFQGFDLYYRFYAKDTDININAWDENDYHDPVTQLTTNGFLPICRAGDTPPSRVAPLIPVETSVRLQSFAVDVYIDFLPSGPGIPSSYYSYTPPLPVIPPPTPVTGEVRRNAQDPTSGYGYKSFAGNNVTLPGGTTARYPDNADMSTQLWAACGGTTGAAWAYIALYAMSYGLAGGTTPLWSAPVYLGFLYVQINY
jgi:hypothetical protein